MQVVYDSLPENEGHTMAIVSTGSTNIVPKTKTFSFRFVKFLHAGY